jgi:two-component system, cell cycle sensor histidine kinase and response regulator CckA
MRSSPIILIVDDVEANRETLLQLLEPGGYELLEARNGPEALRIAGEKLPDLILLDVMMPGMDGYEVCRRLRADPQLGEVPVVMVTAMDDQPSRIAGLDAGADDFISKPFNRAELRARVRTITRLNRYRRLVDTQKQVREQARWLDEARDAIYACDSEARIIYWNEGATRLFGWTREEVFGKPVHEILSGSDAAHLEASRAATREKGEWRGELTHMTNAGREVVVAGRMTVLPDESQALAGFLSINTDVTETKRVEKLMLRTQRLESIGALASGIAHDLNNSLAPILMGLEVLRDGYPDEPMLATMETSAERGADMVRQLLGFAKGVEGSRLLIQPQILLNEIEKTIRGTFPKSIELEKNYPANLQTIRGDATQMHQVLLNLCINARDAMPEGGTLTLEAENTVLTGDHPDLGTDAEPGPYVVWRITDTGSGIAPENLERIFEPFFSTKGPDQGTGLGLSTAFGIVKGHDGFLRVSSVQGVGSTFSIYLPAAGPDAGAAAPAVRSETTYRGSGELILVVDDEPTVRQMTRLVLADLNWNVITASNGTEALLEVRKHGPALRAIITDQNMPQMDGLSFVRILKQKLPRVSIIVASGRMEEPERLSFMESGVHALLAKPFTRETLIETLKSVLTSG